MRSIVAEARTEQKEARMHLDRDPVCAAFRDDRCAVALAAAADDCFAIA